MAKTFEELSKIDVSPWVENKNGLDYISWAKALQLAEATGEELSWVFTKTPEGSKLLREGQGGSVEVTVTIGDKSRTQSLAVFDFKNKAIPYDNITSTDVENTAQRALTKAFALFGIGIQLYQKDVPLNGSGASATTAVKKAEIISADRLSELNVKVDELRKLSAEGTTSTRLQQLALSHAKINSSWTALNTAQADAVDIILTNFILKATEKQVADQK